MRCSVLQCVKHCVSPQHDFIVFARLCCSVSQCVAVRCSVLQCVHHHSTALVQHIHMCMCVCVSKKTHIYEKCVCTCVCEGRGDSYQFPADSTAKQVTEAQGMLRYSVLLPDQPYISTLLHYHMHFAVCCSMLHGVVVCCSVLQCIAACCRVLECVAACCRVLQCIAVNIVCTFYNVLKCTLDTTPSHVCKNKILHACDVTHSHVCAATFSHS